jgi:hypothetical protein
VTLDGGGEVRYGALLHLLFPPGATSFEQARFLRSEIRLD